MVREGIWTMLLLIAFCSLWKMCCDWTISAAYCRIVPLFTAKDGSFWMREIRLHLHPYTLRVDQLMTRAPLYVCCLCLVFQYVHLRLLVLQFQPHRLARIHEQRRFEAKVDACNRRNRWLRLRINTLIVYRMLTFGFPLRHNIQAFLMPWPELCMHFSCHASRTSHIVNGTRQAPRV